MVSVMFYPYILCVALLMYKFVLCVAFLTVFVNCLVKQFEICLGVVAVLLLNVMEVFSVGGGALLDIDIDIECACCACDPSVYLSVPSIVFLMLLYVGSYIFN